MSSTAATSQLSDDKSTPVFSPSSYAGIEGKVVIVTGGGSGIGQAMAQGFASNRAHLMLIDIDEPAMLRVRSALLERFPDLHVETFMASVTDEAAVDRAFSFCMERFGKIDVLLNNAGIAVNKPSLELEPSEWRRGIDINLNSVFICAQAAARRMIGKRGVIINTASMWGVSHAPERAAYCSSKAAVVSLTKCLAVEWAYHGIRVNAIGPGYTRTPLMEQLNREGRLDFEKLIRRTPLGRLGEPGEMAELAMFLASESATFITGQVFVADGGWTANGFM